MAFSAPSFSQILQSAVNNYTSQLTYFGYPNGITPTDVEYISLTTKATTTAQLYQYCNQLVNSKLLFAATGTDLDTIGNILGFLRRAATPAFGGINLVCSQPVTLVSGSLLTGPQGFTFSVQQTGVYSNNQLVNIVSVDTGSTTNLATGAIMTWQAAPSSVQSTCLVSVACTGGVDAETDESFRSRIYLGVQSPQQAGNASQIITTATGIDPIVQQAFCYPNINGAGTNLIALVGYPTFAYPGRDIPHLQYDGYVTAYGVPLVLNPILQLQSPLPGSGGSGLWPYTSYVNVGPNLSQDTSAILGQQNVTQANPFATTVTTVNNVPGDIACVLTLPYPLGTSPNGRGGGWVNANPWPVPDGEFIVGACGLISSNTAGTVITIYAPSAVANGGAYINQQPVAGQTQIQWVNRSNANLAGPQVINATILSFTDNGNNTWTLTLDTPLVFAPGSTDFWGNTGIAFDDYIFPASLNAQTYVNNIMTGYALLGPGQCTSANGLIALGALRYPNVNTVYPTFVGESVEKILVSNTEVIGAQLNPGNANGDLCYNNTYPIGSVNTPINACPPNIFVSRQLGFYPIETYNFAK